MFRTLSGFETFEGAPHAQSCSCNIAKHHLRGYGMVRWEGTTALIECEESVRKPHLETMVNWRALREETSSQQQEIVHLRSE